MLKNAKHDDLIPPLPTATLNLRTEHDGEPWSSARYFSPPTPIGSRPGEATSTTVSLFFNIVFILFVLLLLNLLFKADCAPRRAKSR